MRSYTREAWGAIRSDPFLRKILQTSSKQDGSWTLQALREAVGVHGKPAPYEKTRRAIETLDHLGLATYVEPGPKKSAGMSIQLTPIGRQLLKGIVHDTDRFEALQRLIAPHISTVFLNGYGNSINRSQLVMKWTEEYNPDTALAKKIQDFEQEKKKQDHGHLYNGYCVGVRSFKLPRDVHESQEPKLEMQLHGIRYFQKLYQVQALAPRPDGSPGQARKDLLGDINGAKRAPGNLPCQLGFQVLVRTSDGTFFVQERRPTLAVASGSLGSSSDGGMSWRLQPTLSDDTVLSVDDFTDGGPDIFKTIYREMREELGATVEGFNAIRLDAPFSTEREQHEKPELLEAYFPVELVAFAYDDNLCEYDFIGFCQSHLTFKETEQMFLAASDHAEVRRLVPFNGHTELFRELLENPDRFAPRSRGLLPHALQYCQMRTNSSISE